MKDARFSFVKPSVLTVVMEIVRLPPLNRPLTAAGQVKESAQRLGQGTGPNHFGGNVVQLAVALLTGTDQHLERSF